LQNSYLLNDIPQILIHFIYGVEKAIPVYTIESGTNEFFRISFSYFNFSSFFLLRNDARGMSESEFSMKPQKISLINDSEKEEKTNTRNPPRPKKTGLIDVI